jgi:hypothetical protein
MAEDPPVPEFDFPARDETPASERRAAPAAEPAPQEPAPAEPEPAEARPAGESEVGFLSSRPPRRHLESVFVRVVATAGIVGIGTAVAAVLSTLDVAGWMIGLVVALLSVILAALLWRSRVL